MNELYMYAYTLIPMIVRWAMGITLFIFAVILLHQIIKFFRLKNEAMSKALEVKDASGETQD
ncbi:MAG: hypothetical protein AAGU32_16995 [Bacillota bacterium]|jgi:hypothetical protein